MTTLDFRLSRRARTALLVPTLMLPASAAAQDPVTTLDSVTVTATRTETTALDAPAAITVIGRDEIDRTQATSLDDAIRHVPGVEMSGGPRASAEQANIRGMGGTRVVVRTDGVRKNFESGHRGRIFQDLDLVEQIDILRGPSSMLYGSGAIGGVINIETKDARDLLEPGQTVGAQVKTGFQSNASHRHGSITAYAAPSDHVDFLVSGSRRSAGDAETGDGRTIAFSNDSSAAGLAKATISGRGHGVEVTAQRYQLWNEIPTAANDGTSTTVADRTLREASGSLRYTFDAPDSDLIDVAASVYASDTRIKEQLLSNGRDDRTELMTVGLDVANTSRFELSDTLGLALTIGGEAYQDEQSGYRNGAPRAQYPGAEATTQAGFVQGEFTLFDRLSLTPGLRLDHYERDASGQRSVAEDELSKKLAVSYDVTSSLTVFGSYSEAFRAPELTELYAGGVHFANNRFVPNPDLKPETAENKEIGASLRLDDVVSDTDSLRIKGSAYQNDVENYIEQVVSGGALGTTTSRNVSNARIDGFELEAAYDSPQAFGSVGFAHTEGSNTVTGGPLANIPEDKLSVLAGWRVPGMDTTIGWRGTLLFGQTDVPSGSTDATPGRKVVHDLFVSWEPSQEALDGLRVDFGVDNVLDKSYRRHLSSQYEQGRNVMLSASMKF